LSRIADQAGRHDRGQARHRHGCAHSRPHGPSGSPLPPKQLSGGQEQRVAIARAIVSDPAILVADEPTGDLDAKSGDEILTLLNRLNTEVGKTIVMVTHDPKAASRAHRMVHLDKGVLHTDELTETGTMRRQ